MYAVGDLYLLDTLTDHAIESLEGKLSTFQESGHEDFWSEFKEVVSSIYSLPAGRDRHRRVREILSNCAQSRLKRLEGEDFPRLQVLEICKFSPEFGVDMILGYDQEARRLRL